MNDSPSGAGAASSTRCPFRASSMAVVAPAHRAPITIASYIGPPVGCSPTVRLPFHFHASDPTAHVGDPNASAVRDSTRSRARTPISDR